VLVEKHKVLQILINLITNAKKAVAEAKAMGGNVSVNLGVATDESPPVARIRVMDTGVGIAPDNMKKIFQHGFTTRKDGHGFGLHTAAIDAREMGGLLRVDSAGAGQGATFTLDIPLVPRRVFQT
jgi:signal transduction histidine kinase